MASGWIHTAGYPASAQSMQWMMEASPNSYPFTHLHYGWTACVKVILWEAEKKKKDGKIATKSQLQKKSD